MVGASGLGIMAELSVEFVVARSEVMGLLEPGRYSVLGVGGKLGVWLATTGVGVVEFCDASLYASGTNDNVDAGCFVIVTACDNSGAVGTAVPKSGNCVG